MQQVAKVKYFALNYKLSTTGSILAICWHQNYCLFPERRKICIEHNCINVRHLILLYIVENTDVLVKTINI